MKCHLLEIAHECDVFRELRRLPLFRGDAEITLRIEEDLLRGATSWCDTGHHPTHRHDSVLNRTHQKLSGISPNTVVTVDATSCHVVSTVSCDSMTDFYLCDASAHALPSAGMLHRSAVFHALPCQFLVSSVSGSQLQIGTLGSFSPDPRSSLGIASIITDNGDRSAITDHTESERECASPFPESKRRGARNLTSATEDISDTPR